VPNYEGPYLVKMAFLRWALTLTGMDGEDLIRPMNSDSIKKYYPWWSFISHQIKSIKWSFGQEILFAYIPFLSWMFVDTKEPTNTSLKPRMIS
jgi:hypothetical protein